MQTKTTSTKINCLDIVHKLNLNNVISDVGKLFNYLTAGDVDLKTECMYLLAEKEHQATSVDAFIKELEEVYDFVSNNDSKGPSVDPASSISILVTKKELALIEWIRTVGCLGRSIRNVHDHAVHFSEIQIEGEIKGDLYLTAQIAELVDAAERKN